VLNRPNRRYVVLNRPYAFVQWTQKVKIPETYVLMSEPDHIYLRPMPNFMRGNAPGEPAACLPLQPIPLPPSPALVSSRRCHSSCTF
jgi:hypothetical protein